jgi:hypothetical protein
MLSINLQETPGAYFNLKAVVPSSGYCSQERWNWIIVRHNLEGQSINIDLREVLKSYTLHWLRSAGW